jgi:hypothetical protein
MEAHRNPDFFALDVVTISAILAFRVSQRAAHRLPCLLGAALSTGYLTPQSRFSICG